MCVCVCVCVCVEMGGVGEEGCLFCWCVLKRGAFLRKKHSFLSRTFLPSLKPFLFNCVYGVHFKMKLINLCTHRRLRNFCLYFMNCLALCILVLCTLVCFRHPMKKVLKKKLFWKKDQLKLISIFMNIIDD